MRFAQHIKAAHGAGELVVQPRMGMHLPNAMREGLLKVRNANATTVGTITLDSYTRVGDLASAESALASGRELNGFPIVNHGVEVTCHMLSGVQTSDFPVQVRHGSARPEHIFSAVLACGIDATEGGPVSYCLPYGRTPLREAISAWRRCADLVAQSATSEQSVHIETFGGCMLGQMCPPAMLVAISVLEAIFFAQRGVPSVSLSYAQQTSPAQDVAAIRVMRRLAARWLPDTDWHVVLYTYMGVFPRTIGGAQDLLRQSVAIALHGNAQRLIVKTTAEAHRIPSVQENIDAIETATKHWKDLRRGLVSQTIEADLLSEPWTERIFEEANALIESVLSLHSDVGECLRKAFAAGLLDIPFCLHRDNQGLARAYVEQDGSLQWLHTGRLPFKGPRGSRHVEPLDPFAFLQMLSTVEQRFDAKHLSQGAKSDVLTSSESTGKGVSQAFKPFSKGVEA